MTLAHSYSSFKQFKNCQLAYYRQRILKDVQSTMGPEAAEGDRQHKAVEHRIAYGTPLPSDLTRYEPLCIAVEQATRNCSVFPEKEMVLTQNLQPTGWWDKDAWFRCKADLLALNRGDTRAVIFDWKTGKRRPDFLQMELMALATFIYYPTVRRVDTMFVWLRDRAEDSETYRRADIPKLTEILLTNAARIERALEKERWPATPSPLCGWCPAKPTCRWA